MIETQVLLKLSSVLVVASSLSSARAQYLEEPWPAEVNPPIQIVERGQDHAVYRQIKTISDSNGSLTQTNQFTLLENGLHYFENGAWRESEDLVESFPDGAIARRGPNKAIFSHELNTDAVFDIEASDGKRIRGAIRAIQLTDVSSRKSVVLGTVKDTATAQLFPPNKIVFADAFTGIKADVVLVWKHNSFSHDVILREQPELPVDSDAANVRLEVVTEFIVDIAPELRKSPARSGDAAIEDDTVIHFGALAMVTGKAFHLDEENAVNLGGFSTEGSPVIKKWHQGGDGRSFLVESVSWTEAQEHIKDLPLSRQASVKSPPPHTSLARAFPKRSRLSKKAEPIQLASSDYQPAGYLIDFVIIPDAGTPATLSSGQTYYIKTSYYSGSSVTFQAGCVVKFKDNANMVLYGTVSFPATGGASMPVFTSRNDDTFGEPIAGVTGETPSYSNGDPTLHRAAQAIWIYYPTTSVTIRNARFHWAKMGIRRDGGGSTTMTVQNCFFQSITGTGTYGVYGDISNSTFSNLKKCDVTNPGVTMVTDCIGMENILTGTDTWKLNNTTTPVTPGWPGWTTEPEIEGFASLTSVNQGQTLSFYVKVKNPAADTKYLMEIYRMGYYGGYGARRMIWHDTEATYSGTYIEKNSTTATQTPPIRDTSNGVIDCLDDNVNGTARQPWQISYSLTVPKNWLSGIYLAKLITVQSRKASYVIFVVREDTRGSDLYFQSSVTTYQAYNPWGGDCLYAFPRYKTVCGSPNYDGPSDIATKVSFNRPYAGPFASPCSRHLGVDLSYGRGAGEFLGTINENAEPGWEYNALRFIEKLGYDVTYCTDVDTHSTPIVSTTKPVKVFISLGHDEYWSENMRTNVIAARDHATTPVNLAFMGANTCYRYIAFDTNIDPKFNLRSFSAGGTWRFVNLHESEIVGVEYVYDTVDDVLTPGDITIPDDTYHPWVFTHTGIETGGTVNGPVILNGLLGFEIDGYWTGTSCKSGPELLPAKSTILADSPVYNACSPGDVVNVPHGCMTIYTADTGPTDPTKRAQVFATGSMHWLWGLDSYGYSTSGFAASRVNPIAQQITHNVLQRFSGKPLTDLP